MHQKECLSIFILKRHTYDATNYVKVRYTLKDNYYKEDANECNRTQVKKTNIKILCRKVLYLTFLEV